MNDSAEYSTSSASSISERRGSSLGLPYLAWISSSSERTSAHRPPSSLSKPAIRRDRSRLSASSVWITWISRRASRYSFSSRMASVCSASSENCAMIFSAESALPSDLRMILMISSSASKTFSKPSRMWMRRLSWANSCSKRLVTTSRRKWRKCQSICLRSRRSGRPASAFSVGTRHVMLTANVVCNDVCLNRYAMTRLSSAPDLTSSSIRTSSVETSRTSTRYGILRLSTTSPICSTNCDLFTAYGMLVM